MDTSNRQNCGRWYERQLAELLSFLTDEESEIVVVGTPVDIEENVVLHLKPTLMYRQALLQHPKSSE
jgi:hypothetical protein